MKKLMSIAAIALFVAGSSAFACGCDKTSEKGDKEKTACSGQKKGENKEQQTACGGSSDKHDETKKAA
jgi:hypothetical protein